MGDEPRKTKQNKMDKHLQDLYAGLGGLDKGGSHRRKKSLGRRAQRLQKEGAAEGGRERLNFENGGRRGGGWLR